MKTYTVIGIYKDDEGRFAEKYVCETPEDAERMAIEDYDSTGNAGLIIAGVLTVTNGEIEVVL